jgi:hypothetical protein
MTRTYNSKIDTWLAVILIFCAFIPVFLVLPIGLVTHKYAILPISILPMALMSLLVFPLKYEIGQRELRIRSGIIRFQVPFKEIREVTPTRSPISSPALSLDRLRIQYGRKAIMISPEDKYSFLEDLARATGLRHDGDALKPK